MILTIVHDNGITGEYHFIDEKINCISDVQYFLRQCEMFGFHVYDWIVLNEYVL